MPQLLAGPKEDVEYSILANDIWRQALQHCVNSIDRNIISFGVNAAKNLFYGRYYKLLSTGHWLRPPFNVLDEQVLLNKDVYFIRSTDLSLASSLPYFTICIAFVHSDSEEFGRNGSFSTMVEDQPTITLFVKAPTRVMTNYTTIKRLFEALQTSDQSRSTFVHEFTHMIDDTRYSSTWRHPTLKPGLPENEAYDAYINLNHEVNARYIQFIHAILYSLNSVPGFATQGMVRTFSSFEAFYMYFTNARYYPQSEYLQILSPKNKKRVQSRLYQFYRYLINQELLHNVSDKKALEFASDQVLKDNGHA